MSGPWFHQPNIKAWVENCFQSALQIILFLLLHIASHLGQRISNFQVQDQPVASFFCTCDMGNLWQIFPPLHTSSISRWRNHGFLHHTGCHQHHFLLCCAQNYGSKDLLGFSRVFREWIAEHKNPQGILENRAPTDASILFAKCLCHFFSCDTPRVPTRYQLNCNPSSLYAHTALGCRLCWNWACDQLHSMQALIPVKPMASGPYSGKVQGLRPYTWCWDLKSQCQLLLNIGQLLQQTQLFKMSLWSFLCNHIYIYVS